ncbi:MAG: hypothetical protein U5R31_10705 [Acidimicrobiia bacterium]|nr:hypothetical protein [Acidimicrobiia bacterium]
MVDAVLVDDLVVGERPSHDIEADGVEVASGPLDQLGSWAEQRRALRLDEAERALLLEPAHRGGVEGFGPGSNLEPLLEGGAEIEPVGESRDQAVDGLDGQLVLGQLDHVGHRQVVGAGRVAVGPPLVAVGERRLVPVVAVGHDDGS